MEPAAVERKERDQKGEIIGYACPYCGMSWAKVWVDGIDYQGNASRLACCGEVGHCVPIYENQDED